MCRRWVALVSLAGLLAACSGSNGVISLGMDAGDDAGEGDDTSPADDASSGDGGSHGGEQGDASPGDADADVSENADADDASGDDAASRSDAGDATVDAGPDAAGPDASDAAGVPDAEVTPDAAFDAGPDAAFDAGPDAADAGPDATAPDDAGADATAPDDAAPPVDAAPPDAEGDDASPGDAADDAPSCAAGASAAGWFVDQVHGTDDPQHGGAAGACAFRTITYALTLATGHISVAAGTYSAASGETLPFVLGDRQGLFCKGATLSGEGKYGSTRANTVLAGTANVVNGCTIVGNGKSGSCIIVATDGSGSGHDLESLDVSMCTDAAVRVQGTQVRIADSSFYDSGAGVTWEATDPTGVMEGNWFADNADVDVVCTGGDHDVTGSGNQDSSSSVSCEACDMCPFD